MDVAVAAKLAEISVEDFRSLNPSAHRPVLLAAGSPQILLPWENAEVFQRNYEAFGGARLASWTAWVAPATMKVAEAAKRVGMSEASFRQLNSIPPRMLVKAGAVLLIPRGNHQDQDVASSIADHGQLALAAESVAAKRAKGKSKAKGKGAQASASTQGSQGGKKSSPSGASASASQGKGHDGRKTPVR